jgi:hypothetical protein
MRGADFAPALICALLAGCGPSADTPAPTATGAKPDAIVTLDGRRHACVVALKKEAQGSIISCDDIVPFVRDELRLASGSTYELRSVADGDEATMAKVDAILKGAGYRALSHR